MDANRKTIFDLDDIDFIREEYQKFSKYQRELLEKWLTQLDNERRKFENEFSLNEVVDKNSNNNNSDKNSVKFELKNVSVQDRNNREVNFLNLVIVAEKTKDGIILKNVTLDEVNDETQEVLLNWGNVIPSNPTTADLDAIFSRADKLVMEKVSELEENAKKSLEKEAKKVVIESADPNKKIEIVQENESDELEDYLDENNSQSNTASVKSTENKVENFPDEPEQKEEQETKQEKTSEIIVEKMDADEMLSLFEEEDEVTNNAEDIEEKQLDKEPHKNNDDTMNDIEAEIEVVEEKKTGLESYMEEDSPITILPDNDDLESLDDFEEKYANDNKQDMKIADATAEYPISASCIDDSSEIKPEDAVIEELTFRDHLTILDTMSQSNSHLYNPFDIIGYKNAIALIEQKHSLDDEVKNEQVVLSENTNKKELSASPSMIVPQ